MAASNTASQYYVRMNGKIRGPFDTERLRSMRQRHRLGARDELSADRRKWVLAGSVTDVFPEGFTGVEPDPEAADWYFMRSGQQHGPFPLAALQGLAQSDGLAPHDSVWRLGTPGWVLASQVPELAFAPPRSWWQSLHGGIRLGIIAAGVLLFIAPIWMVFSYYSNQTSAAREQIRQQIENEKWLAEQKLKKEMHDEDLRSKKEMHKEDIAKLDEREAAAQKRHDQQMSSAQQGGSAVGNSGNSGSGSGKYSIGDTVVYDYKVFGIPQRGWSGTIVGINGSSYRIRLNSVSKHEWNRYRGSRTGDEVTMVEGEFK